MKTLLFGLIFLNGIHFFAQVSIISSNYSQNFGTTTKASWTDNSTFPGWYLSAGGTFYYGGTQNITTSAPTNTGGFYTYQCNSDGNIKLGSRPSNTSGGSSGTGQSHIGLRIQNNTGQTIESITVLYTGLQLSLAENGTGNTNSFIFSYHVSSSAITSLTSGTWTNVAALNYNAPNNSATQGSNQVSGYACTVSSNISSCINTPAIANGSEIMLRWSDVNNTYNDHHLAIDDVQVLFHFNDFCGITLPIELLTFEGNHNYEQGLNNIEWKTASENNNYGFELESSLDGLNWEFLCFKNGNGESVVSTDYDYQHRTTNTKTYYRLTQIDYNGSKSMVGIIVVYIKEQENLETYYIDLLGKILDGKPNHGSYIRVTKGSNGVEFNQFHRLKY
jgi:hypothetical protein